MINMGSVGTTRNINTIFNNNPRLENTVEKAFRKANLIGEDVDLYNVMYSYKTLQKLPEQDIEIIYDYLSERLGFTR